MGGEVAKSRLLLGKRCSALVICGLFTACLTGQRKQLLLGSIQAFTQFLDCLDIIWSGSYSLCRIQDTELRSFLAGLVARHASGIGSRGLEHLCIVSTREGHLEVIIYEIGIINCLYFE